MEAWLKKRHSRGLTRTFLSKPDLFVVTLFPVAAELFLSCPESLTLANTFEVAGERDRDRLLSSGLRCLSLEDENAADDIVVLEETASIPENKRGAELLRWLIELVNSRVSPSSSCS